MGPRTKNVGIKRKKMYVGESSNSFHSGYFTNLNHSKLYDSDFSLRPLDRTFVLDLPWFRNKGFEFIDWLENYKLLDFLTSKGSCAPELVKAFYTTLSFDEATETISAELKGIKINLTLDEFSSISLLPNQGEKLVDMCSPNSWTSFRYSVACTSLCHPVADVKKRPILANSLSTQIRLLHYVVARCITPKHSNFASVNLDEVTLLWGMKNKKSINWAHLVVSHMMRCKKNTGKHLPYGVLITSLLRLCNVSFSGEKIQKITEVCRPFSISTVNQMKLVKDGDVWYQASVGLASVEEHDPIDVEPMSPSDEWARFDDVIPEPAPSNPNHTSNAAAPPSSSLDHILAAITTLQTEQRQMFADLRQEIISSRESQSREITALNTRMHEFETRVGSYTFWLQDT